MMGAFALSWSNDPERVASVGDVLSRLRALHAEFMLTEPTLVSITRENGDSLTIGLGRDLSVLTFMRGDATPPYLTSIDPTRHSDDSEILSYDHCVRGPSLRCATPSRWSWHWRPSGSSAKPASLPSWCTGKRSEQASGRPKLFAFHTLALPDMNLQLFTQLPRPARARGHHNVVCHRTSRVPGRWR